MTLNRAALVGLFCGVAGVSACTTVRPIQPAEYLEDNAPPVVWVTYTDNTVVSIAEAEVRRDTLRGMLQGARVKIPLSEIQSVQARVRDGRKTAIVLTVLGIGAVTGIYLQWVSKSGPDALTIDCANDAVEEHPEEHPECGG